MSASSEAVRLVSIRRDGVARTVTVLGPVRRLEYERVVATVAPLVEADLSSRVMANRVAASTLEPPTLCLRPWVGERRRFAAALATLAASHPILGFADVAACYASIRPGVVREALERLGAKGRRAEGFLSSLARDGVPGLPVGPHPSAVLANAVLGHVDRALEAAGIPHLRWVDDLVLGLEGTADGAGAFDLIRGALDDLGLRLNEAKTRLVSQPAAMAAISVSDGRGRPASLG